MLCWDLKDARKGNELCLPDAPELPITRKEMLLILEPLESCLQRIESRLWELGRERNIAPSPVKSSARRGLEKETCALVGNRDVGATGAELITVPVHEKDMLRWAQNGTHSDADGPTVEISSFDFHIEDSKGMNLVEQVKIKRSLSDKHLLDDPQEQCLDGCISLLEKMASRWSSIKEPQQSNWISRLVISNWFEAVVHIAIIFNAGLLAYMADWEIQHIGMSSPQILGVLESCFLAFFSLELLLRLVAHRLYFFVNDDMRWNIFDFTLVSISIADVILLKYYSGQGGPNVGFIRLVRLLKICRVLRSIRLFRFFPSLSVLLESLRNSLAPLFWGFILLGFLLYLFALSFVQGLAAYLNGQDIDPRERREIESKFGSLFRAMFSLYSSLTGADDWIVYYNIVEKAGSMYGFLFVLLITFSSFAVFNLITGLLVERAMASAQPNRSEQIMQHRKNTSEQKSQFLEICRKMDVDNNGRISWSEFQAWLKNPVMLTYMASIGLDVYDVELFFTTVAARPTNSRRAVSEGEVTFEHFVEGCMHMRGQATAIDMQRQLFESHILQQEVKHFEESLTDKIQRLEDLVDQGFSALSTLMLPKEHMIPNRVVWCS